MRKKTDRINKLEILGYVLFFILGLATGFLIHNHSGNLLPTMTQKPVSVYESDILEDCQDLSVFATAHCLRDNVLTFYEYRENDDNIELSFEELRLYGGDCFDWAKLYADLGQQLGFNSNIDIFPLTDEEAHAHAIISDKTGYCLLEQEYVICFKINNGAIADE